MRYLKMFGLVILATAFCNPGASAQNAPSGSYQQSCRNVGVDGSTLYASCRNGNGEWQSARLPDFQRCAGEIGNDNGTLRCDMRVNNDRPAREGNRQNGVPTGNYAQTCRDIRTNGNALEATCEQRNGEWTRTALQDFNQCTSSIENIDGRLECTKGNYGQDNRRDNVQDNGQGYRRDGGPERRDNYEVPDGPFAQNCRNVRVSGSTLLATCRQRNGRWRAASLREFNQCTSEIENNNGRLMCSR
jgi:CVNH domain-containing protein